MAAAKQALEIAKIKLEAGMITKVDLIQVESEMAIKETALSKARRDLAVDKAKIASLTGTTGAFDLEKVDFTRYEALMAKAASYDEATADSLAVSVQKAAYAGNPSLERYAVLGEEARKAVEQAATGYFPTVTASFTHRLSFANAAFDATAGSLSVSASMPIDFWKTDNKVMAADTAARGAALDLDEQRRNLDLEVLTAVADCVSQARSVQSSQKALEYAESNYRNVLELYRLSSKPVADLLDAEAAVGTGKETQIAARYGFLSNLSTLRSLGAFESYETLLAMFP
jgi:outer membrane protein TolC